MAPARLSAAGPAAIALLAAGLVLGACRHDEGAVPASVATAAASASAAAATPVPAEPAPAQRIGDWQGGPEPLSGKLPTGIVTWWQLRPATPRPGEAFELTLRSEGAIRPGAMLSLRAGDGARLVGVAPGMSWALPVGTPSQVRVQVVAPAGDSYMHVFTRQGERYGARSIRIALPGVNPSAAARQRDDYATDSRGEPIVRMPAAAASQP